MLLASVALAPAVFGQAPGVLWTNNLGARLFAVDGQTNVYANTNGTVIILNSSGVALQTNTICPRPGWAQRDAAGNYYFAGPMPTYSPDGTFLYPAPQDFGGVVLSNSMIFVAKYDAAGALLWATNCGPTGGVRNVLVTDFQLDPNGNAYVGYSYYISTMSHYSELARIGSAGVVEWSVAPPKYVSWSTVIGGVRLGGISPTNGYVLTYVSASPSYVTLSQFDTSGTIAAVNSWTGEYLMSAKPVCDSAGALFNVEGSQLTKRSSSGSLMWSSNVVGTAWIVGQDSLEGVHVANTMNQLWRYDSDGHPVWSLNLPSSCNAFILDASGNRFVSLDSGALMRLGSEPLSAPSITTAPQGQTLLAGSNAVLNVVASGSTPLRYQWLFESNSITNATNATLSLGAATTAKAGWYSVIVTNVAGAITSAPALLRVKSVAIFLGDALLTNGTYVFATNPVFNIRSAFPSGTVFYTLDGSAPSFGSTPYAVPFPLSVSASIRAIGYSSDYLQSEEADVVDAVVLPRNNLAVMSSGGGTVGVYPAGCIAPPADLVACWRFEGNANDSISTNHGIEQGSVNYGAGLVGRAAEFNGQGGIAVPSSPSLNVGLSNGMTVECWFKWTTATFSPLVQWNAASGGSIFYHGYAGILLYDTGGLEAGFKVGNSLLTIQTAAGLVSSNAYHHVALTYDKTSGVAAIYLDGQVVAQDNLGIFTPITSDLVYLGKTRSGNYAGASMDEVSIYGRALTISEIQQISSAGSSGKCVPVPATGSYLPGETVIATAVPASGWTFLHWLGDAAGTGAVASISMERDKTVKAVFGTTLSTTVAGSGQVLHSPSNSFYPYGTTVRLTAVPQAGNYFGFWGNAATGNTNPLCFTVTSANPVISSIFGSLVSTQSALTVMINGHGQVRVSPRANVYHTNQTAVLTAVPDAAQSFIGWSGDASGTQNPLSVPMRQSKVITANFTSRPGLSANGGLNGMTPEGFRLTLLGDSPASFELFTSTNLSDWVSLGVTTNTYGEVQILDPATAGFPCKYYKALGPQ